VQEVEDIMADTFLNIRNLRKAFGPTTVVQDFNLDVYIPLSTLRARIGDIVVTSDANDLREHRPPTELGD
jgi:hypothetical protein